LAKTGPHYFSTRETWSFFPERTGEGKGKKREGEKKKKKIDTKVKKWYGNTPVFYQASQVVGKEGTTKGVLRPGVRIVYGLT